MLQLNNLKKIFSNIEVLSFYLTLVPALSYGVMYCFAYGLNEYYGLPSSFIDLSFNTSVGTTVSVFFFFVIFSFYIVNFNDKIERLKSDTVKMRVLSFVSTIFTFVILVLILKFSFDFSFQSILLVLALPSLALVVTLVLRMNKNNFMIWSILIVVVMTGAYFLGKQKAHKKEDYFVIEWEKGQNYVVLNEFDKQFIIAPIDLQSKTITPQFQFIEMKSDKDNKAELKLMHTGKLKVKKYVD